MSFSRREWLFQTLTLKGTSVQGNYYRRNHLVTRSTCKTRSFKRNQSHKVCQQEKRLHRKNYLQNSGASNYDYESLENEIAELRNNGIIDEKFKITIPMKKC